MSRDLFSFFLRAGSSPPFFTDLISPGRRGISRQTIFTSFPPRVSSAVGRDNEKRKRNRRQGEREKMRVDNKGNGRIVPLSRRGWRYISRRAAYTQTRGPTSRRFENSETLAPSGFYFTIGSRATVKTRSISGCKFMAASNTCSGGRNIATDSRQPYKIPLTVAFCAGPVKVLRSGNALSYRYACPLTTSSFPRRSSFLSFILAPLSTNMYLGEA